MSAYPWGYCSIPVPIYELDQSKVGLIKRDRHVGHVIWISSNQIKMIFDCRWGWWRNRPSVSLKWDFANEGRDLSFRRRNERITKRENRIERSRSEPKAELAGKGSGSDWPQCCGVCDSADLIGADWFSEAKSEEPREKGIERDRVEAVIGF
ncbi:hypothetical protein Bca52824_028458 [Brassica carinata]|uniref:Uncharacterized protein n=1 Tax=Brassica carinata TaxID=52824 RepID=A0A8X8AN06_BRACI|nr:hypothetical protein Bca52824_028458 [Brassica carinata]